MRVGETHPAAALPAPRFSSALRGRRTAEAAANPTGLYAGGEVAGGVHGASRLGTVAVIDALTFGMIAGENFAKMQ